MTSLFEIETKELVITFSRVREADRRVPAGGRGPCGLLRLTPRRRGVEFIKINRGPDVPPELSCRSEETAGPRIYEETDYRLDVQSKSGEQVAVLHPDPMIQSGLTRVYDGCAVVGLVNFGSQAGYSTFQVQIGGKPDVDLEVEVFPTKLDYRADYDQMLADVQEILVGLALEYLRGTYLRAEEARQPRSTEVEWLALLRHVVGDLELALRYVDRHPVRTMRRELLSTRVDRLSRVDSSVRASIRRGTGGAAWVDCGGVRVRERCSEHRAQPTLDTSEHRWLARQVRRIRARLADLRRVETGRRQPTLRTKETARHLADLEARIDRLAGLEALSEATADPPAGFTSQVLISAPGYREAYRACLILARGLRIEGEPLKVSVKDLSVLYEYWCFLAIVRILCEETGRSKEAASSLFTVRQDGLHVQLQRGRKSAVVFPLDGGRRLKVTYNPRFSDDDYLIPQMPDVVISLSEPSWPEQHLVLDAKYRIDGSEQYLARYGCPGPPEDALNAMHRYRDAITEEKDAGAPSRRSHTVVQAAALFPARIVDEEAFRASRLWKSLEGIGVGAVPFLPYEDRFLREWIRSFLHRGGWSLANRAMPHRSVESVWRAQESAEEVVLIGILRPDSAEHLSWVKAEQLYYMPMLKTQALQHAVSAVAVYSPAEITRQGRIEEYALVHDIEVTPRSSIPTPWISTRGHEELQVVFHLGEFRRLNTPVLNANGQRVSSHRWTSRLALDRAVILEELLIETEAEWRLYEDLSAAGIGFSLRAGTPGLAGPDRTRPRVWFVVGDALQICFRGPSGFQVRARGLEDRYVAHLDDVLKMLSEWRIACEQA